MYWIKESPIPIYGFIKPDFLTVYTGYIIRNILLFFRINKYKIFKVLNVLDWIHCVLQLYTCLKILNFLIIIIYKKATTNYLTLFTTSLDFFFLQLSHASFNWIIIIFQVYNISFSNSRNIIFCLNKN